MGTPAMSVLCLSLTDCVLSEVGDHVCCSLLKTSQCSARSLVCGQCSSPEVEITVGGNKQAQGFLSCQNPWAKW